MTPTVNSLPSLLVFGFVFLVAELSGVAAGPSAVLPAALPAGVAPDLVVALDGSGNFPTLQAAIDSIPAGNTERRIIFLRNGTYREHIRIENSFLTLLGEDRLKTRIVWEVNDRRYDPNANADRKGIATLNLANSSDIVIDNLTVENPAAKGGKPFVIGSTGQGTRIVIQRAEILGLGGDSFSLWTRGLYYHRNLHVTGTYHFVGPRGTCYLSDSVIECLGPVNNALFNEGIEDERQKFVLKRCRIVSKVPFGLGSHFRDAAWYFIDCEFPDTLKPDGKIFIAQSNPQSPQPVSAMFKWATDRVYFANAKGPDYPWLKDNIAQSPAKTAAVIDAAWTFSGQWDPESTVPPAAMDIRRADNVVSITFSEAVTVKGRPTLTLTDGATAVYRSGSGSDTLTFAAAAAGDPAKLNLNGGAILASKASAQLRLVPDSLNLGKRF
jgi:pectinesterase